jgi:uncharacterized membrane protein YbaN (DUF454 family)
VKRTAYLVLGFLSVALGAIGIFVPLLPTVVFMIFAAFCFARSNPELERRIVEHPAFKPHVAAWRQRGAISRRGKAAAFAAFAVSSLAGLLLLSFPLMLVPLAVAVIGGGWIHTRPTAEIDDEF